jgi:predicted TIM-barrel fold metal-dependent hydrolase
MGRDHVIDLEVWDVHQHCGSRVTDLLTHSHYPPDTRPGWLADEHAKREHELDRLGIARTVLMPGNSYAKSRGAVDAAHANDLVLQQVSRHPERFLGAVGVAEPQHGRDSLVEIERLHRLGALGLMYHPRLQGVAADDPWIRRQLQLAAELDMVVLFHTYTDSAFEAPTLMHRAFEGLDQLRLIVLDGMSSHRHTAECIQLAQQHPQILFDTAQVWGPFGLAHFVDEIGVERLVFGSNIYSFSGTPGMYSPDRLIEALGDAARGVLHDNLAHFLRLDAGQSATSATA